MTRKDKIRQNLQTALAPRYLDVIDESDGHRGHAGYQEGGESHFRVVIESEVLTALSRLARHRAVHAAIGSDLMSEIHALAIIVRV